MIGVVYYLPATGRIVKAGTIDAEVIELNRPEGTEILFADNANSVSQYVLGGVLTDKSPMEITGKVGTLAVDTPMVIGNIPLGTEFRHPDGVEVVVEADSGEMGWESNASGLFSFRLVNPAYLEEFFYVNVEA
jgi:hypothetical protein